jgi:hypothetical protein
MAQMLVRNMELYQRCSCGVLQSLLANTNQDAVRESGGIPVLVGLAKDGTEAQKENAAGALLSLTAGNLANQDAIHESGGIPVLAGLAKDGTEAQKESAAGALLSLTDGNRANQDAVRESGGLSVLVELAKDGTEAQTDEATLALLNLTDASPRNRDAVRESGGMPALVGLAKDGTERTDATDGTVGLARDHAFEFLEVPASPEQLLNAANGKTEHDGGLNKHAVVAYLKEHGLPSDGDVGTLR